jgi:acetyl-CoA C-acetyltransferase
MVDVFVYDHVRTPRGRGKKDGSLHEVPSVRLASHMLEALRDRNGLDTKKVDDIVMGCVDAIGEAGGDIARAATFEAGYATEAPGIQINRFCASGLDAINFGTAKIAQGADDIVIAGGVESMSRIGIGASGRRLVHGSVGQHSGLLHAAGHIRRPDRHKVRILAR